MIGAIGKALETGAMQAPQAAPSMQLQQLAQDPQFLALAAQYGPQMAMQMMQERRANVSQGVANLQALGQTQDPRLQLAQMAQQAQM